MDGHGHRPAAAHWDMPYPGPDPDVRQGGPYAPGGSDPIDPVTVERREPGGGIRSVEVVAGLLSAGLVLVGGMLLVLQVAITMGGSDGSLGAAVGPGWGRAIAQLVVGLAGEFVVLARRWSGPAVRLLSASAVIGAALLVLWLCWWM